jgi:hypothetical protein
MQRSVAKLTRWCVAVYCDKSQAEIVAEAAANILPVDDARHQLVLKATPQVALDLFLARPMFGLSLSALS